MKKAESNHERFKNLVKLFCCLSNVLVICSLLCIVFWGVNIAEASPEEHVISINTSSNGSTLEAILPSISKQTGYRVMVEDQNKTLFFRGKFIEVKIEEFFRRVLKGINYSLTFDEDLKEIHIVTIGKKKIVDYPVVKHTAEVPRYPERDSFIDDDSFTDDKTTNLLSGTSHAAIRDLHQEQRRRYNRQLEDGTLVNELTGALMSDIAALHEKQASNYTKPVFVDLPAN